MQWFILFGLRASWTSSIIVIHRRKWAARGGAGAGGGPPRFSVARRHSRRQHARAAMHVVYAWRIQSRSVCVCHRWSETGVRASRVQCCRCECTGSCGQEPRAQQCRSQWPARQSPRRRLSWPARLLPANARWVRSISACTRSTSLRVSISSRSRNGSRWIAYTRLVDHHRARRLPKVDDFAGNCVDFSCVAAPAVLINSVGLLRRWVAVAWVVQNVLSRERCRRDSFSCIGFYNQNIVASLWYVVRVEAGATWRGASPAGWQLTSRSRLLRKTRPAGGARPLPRQILLSMYVYAETQLGIHFIASSVY